MTPRPPLQPGLCSVTFRALPVDRVIELAVSAGLHGIEWGADIHVPPADLKRAQHTAATCRDAGLTIPSYGSYIRAGAADPQQALAPVLDTVTELGAANIRVWAGDIGSAEVDAAQRKRVVDALRDCAATAATRHITVSLEYHRNTLTDTLASTTELLREIDHPNCFSYWQPIPEISTDDAVAEVRQLSPALSHFHVFHWHAGNVRQPLADAEAFWRTAFAAATPGNWSRQRYAFLEFVRDDDPTQFVNDAAVLNRILGGLSSADHQQQMATDSDAVLGVP